MEIQELNKKQMILLTLLITFVVSIATGIVTVSLVNQAPKIVPQTINNVIERTIEKVTTVPATTPPATDTTKDTASILPTDDQVLISIYPSDIVSTTTPVSIPVTTTPDTGPTLPKALGQGVIISDVGLVLVDSNILTDAQVYKVTLNNTDFDATVLKKFDNGFTILKISVKKVDTHATI